METKFTPGPWVVCDSGLAVRDGHTTLCEVPRGVEILKDEDEANMRLISAAPDLFEALEDLMLCHAEGGYVQPDPEVFEVARAALKKARGE